jgi:hypothetical protein
MPEFEDEAVVDIVVVAVGQRRLATMSAAILRLPDTRNGPSAHAVMLPSRSNEAKFRFVTVVLYFRMSFWAEDNR